jgi:recombination protein RecA
VDPAPPAAAPSPAPRGDLRALRERLRAKGGAAPCAPPASSLAPAPWSLPALAGLLVECSDAGGGAPLSAAAALVADAHARGEGAAFVGPPGSLPYPPDLEAAGVDTAALAVVRVAGLADRLRAAELLARSGSFGAVVVDLGEGERLPPAAPARLAGLARRHGCAVLLLTRKAASSASAGPTVALRVEAFRRRLGPGRFAAGVRALKDRRGAAGWVREEPAQAPDGMR